MKLGNYFNFLKASLLAPGLLLLTMAPAALAQMHGGAPMGGSSPSNMNNNPNMPPGAAPGFAKQRPDGRAKYVWESSQKL